MYSDGSNPNPSLLLEDPSLFLTAVMFLGFAAAYLRSKGFQGSTYFAKKMELWVSEETE